MAVALGSIRSLPDLLDEVERIPETTVAGTITLLRSTNDEERDDALAALAELVDGAFGEDGARLGQEVRTHGGIPLLTWLLADPSCEIQQTALMVLGNLCSDTVDANSRATKLLLLQCGGERALLSCVFTEEPATLLFACGALQNLCYEREWADLVMKHGVHRRLEALLAHEDGMIVRYASGALKNMMRTLQLDDLSELALEAVQERALEHKREEWLQQRALGRIASAFRAIPEARRRCWHERGTRRRQRMANGAQSDQTDTWSWASSEWSRPSSAASSRSASSHASSYVSARSLK